MPLPGPPGGLEPGGRTPVMTEPGALGRSAPGESWRRAMALVAERHAQGSKKRYEVYGYQIEPGWWAYSFRRARKPPHVATEPRPMSHALIAELSAKLPRCAQRASAQRGGGSKLAITDERLAERMAGFLGVRFYRCSLLAPAIGEHWHMSTSKKKRKARR